MKLMIAMGISTRERLTISLVPVALFTLLTYLLSRAREQPLLLERFSLPTPLLSLYQNERGQLWTPGVTVEVETDMNSASLHVEQSLLAAAGTCRRVAEAREKMARGRLVRAFDRMFG